MKEFRAQSKHKPLSENGFKVKMPFAHIYFKEKSKGETFLINTSHKLFPNDKPSDGIINESGLHYRLTHTKNGVLTNYVFCDIHNLISFINSL